MKTLNSLSGGKTSSYLAVHYPADYNVFALVSIDDVTCKPKDPKIIEYVNDKLFKYGFGQKYGEFIATAEPDEVLYTMMDLEQYLGQEICWVRHHSFETWIKKKGMLPNMKMRYCTTEMKIIPICEFVVQEIFPINDNNPVKMSQGIRFDESDRQKTGENREYRNKIITGKSKNGKRNKWTEFFWAIAHYPLIEDEILHWDIQKYWENKPIAFPKDSNCVGCFWKHEQQLRKNWDNDPKKMNWFSKMERESNHFFKPNIDYDKIRNIGLQSDFFFGTGASGCSSGFCTD